MVIPDLQIPFEAKGALEFCLYVKRHFKIKDEHCLCAGDEVDQYAASTFPKDPDANYTASTELEQSVERLKRWYGEFPKMKLAISNHATRFWKRASEAGIPSKLMRSYKEVIQAPKNWYWQDHWVIEGSNHRFMLTHGMSYGGQTPYRAAPLLEGISVVHGHLHSSAGIAYIRTTNQKLWGFNVGSLIDVDAYAFKYGKYDKFKPNLGVGVIMLGGKMPLWLPFE